MTHYKPDGWPTVIPRIFAEDVSGMVGFLKAVFDARGELRATIPSGMTIGDSRIMVSDGAGMRAPQSAFLYVYVKDADETYQRAIEAGAVGIEKPADMPYGDRRAMVQDSWGNVWQIATHHRRPA